MRGYSFQINIRVRPESEREHKLLTLAKEYNLDPSCALFWRMVDDGYLLIQDRSTRKAEALRKKEDAEKELRRLIAGE